MQESLRRTAEQYHLANSLLRPESQADDGMQTPEGSDGCVAEAEARQAAAPDGDADVCGSGYEDTGKRKAASPATQTSRKMQKRDHDSAQRTPDTRMIRCIPNLIHL
jgi:hypothetical protein